MTALLDANVLIALLDEGHVHHDAAHLWFGQNRSLGWSTCPLTENACIRIISQPAYPGGLPVADIARRLQSATSAVDHQFWADSISFRETATFHHDLILTPRHLTDLYLLALAVRHQGRLVTFDRGIPVAAVPAARDHNLVIL